MIYIYFTVIDFLAVYFVGEEHFNLHLQVMQLLHLSKAKMLKFVFQALNEWDSKFSGGVDWRQKLDTQRGAVLANELKNNACKLAKWTVQAILAGSDQIKFG